MAFRVHPAFLLIAGVLAAQLTRAAGLDDAYERLFQAQLAIAQKGDPQGMYHLGEMYENGLGTAESRAKALEWYDRAAKSGHPLAKRRLEEEQKSVQIARVRDDSEKAAVAARRKAEAEAARAAEAAELARRKADEESLRQAKAAEAAKKKAEDEARLAAERLAKAESDRSAAAKREAARRAAFKKAWEAELKRAKAAGNVFE